MKSTQLIEDLLKTRDNIYSTNIGKELLAIVQSKVPNINKDTFFIIDCITEQCENIYTILIDSESIIEVEISRSEKNKNPINFSLFTVLQYLEKNPYISKITKRKLDTSIRLAKEFE